MVSYGMNEYLFLNSLINSVCVEYLESLWKTNECTKSANSVSLELGLGLFAARKASYCPIG